ncbi:hypothetical protein LINGRAHAP2_LOCUS7058 [Linum grandiflorum]
MAVISRLWRLSEQTSSTSRTLRRWTRSRLSSATSTSHLFAAR